MNAIEERVREAFDRNVGVPPPRTMPAGTRARVRARQAGWVAMVCLSVAAVAFAGFQGLSRLPGDDGKPADGASIVPDHPLEFVPAGWPVVEIGDPADGYVMPPNVTGAHDVGVIASGTVDGAGFSFQSFVGETGGIAEGGACLGFAGPGLGEFASPGPQGPGAVGGVSSGTCAAVQGVPAEHDLYLVGQQDPQQAPGIVANYGFLSDRVARLELRLDDGRIVRIPVIASPPGWDGIQAYLFFPPDGAAGELTAFAADGTALARVGICVANGIAGGCGAPATQLAPLPEPTAT